MDLHPHPHPPGTPTSAGWSFVEEAHLANVAVPAGFVVEIVIDTTGFRVNGRLVSPATVATLIAEVQSAAAVRDAAWPVVVLPQGMVPRSPAADVLFGALADSLGRPVIATDGAVWVDPHGVLSSDGVFRQWQPRDAGSAPDSHASPRHSVVGPTLPPPVVVDRPRPLGATPDPPLQSSLPPMTSAARAGRATALEHAAQPRSAPQIEPMPQTESVPLRAHDLDLVDPRRWSRSWVSVTAHGVLAHALTVGPIVSPTPVGDATTLAPSTNGVPAMASVQPTGRPLEALPAQPVEAAGSPLWIVDGLWRAEDRTRLRRLLNDRYDGYARVIVRTLAEQPGLRGAEAPADLVADLVALLAYHTRERDGVNSTLRMGHDHGSDERETLVARGAAQALRRLPAVLGPVFAAGKPAASVLDGYRAGAELVEPAFVDVALAGVRPPEASIEFVIWSVSARRLDRVGWDDVPTAVFPPGSRFAVLAVDPPTGDGPIRVLMRDRTGDRPGAEGGAQRVLDRLRGAALGDESDRPVRMLAFPPGLDDGGRRFDPPAAGEDAGTDNAGKVRT